MVYGGARLKTKPKIGIGKDILVRTVSKMALPPSSPSDMSHTAKQAQPLQLVCGESETDFNATPSVLHADSLHPNVIKQFEKMLQKALKQTSDHITESLIKEICELDQRTTDLEGKMDDLEINTGSCVNELEDLKEENLTLQNHLGDFENRARRSNLRICRIPETFTDSIYYDRSISRTVTINSC